MIELYGLAAAYVAGLLASLLRLPPLVGYLAAGYGLSVVAIPSNDSIARLAGLGIEFLLFTVGLKLQLSSLLRRDVLGVGGLHMLLVTFGTGLGFFLIDQQVTGGLLLGASLAFSSTVLAVKTLEDNAELSTLHGRITLGILILQDVVAVALLALAGGGQPTPWAFLLLLFPLFRPLASRLFELNGSHELKLLMGVVFALAGGAIAKAVGVSPELGALWMGALLAGHPDAKLLADKLWGLKETFLIAFFLQIGLAGVPGREEVLLALALVALLPVQGWLFFLLFVLVGLRARTAFVSSLALMTYSEFALLTTGVMTEAGLLAESWRGVMGVAVALSLALAAPLNRFSHRIFARMESLLLRFERQRKHPDRAPIVLGMTHWLVMGMGRTGSAAYDVLEKQGYRVLGLDADPARIEAQRDSGRRVLYGDAEDAELWERIHLDGVLGVMLTMPEFDARLSALQYLRSRRFSGLIGVVSYRQNEDPHLSQAGADVIFHPLTQAGERLAEYMLEAAGALRRL
ncbi:MAG TPA: cation:proton antiporter family protein [Methylococcaceae bacterium]|nr:cation:proton antiporter family protein [Methylococcaceae bacterium]